jgi:predicted O-methyltransferase YrrM
MVRMKLQEVMQLADFWPGRILLTAVELGVFHQMAGAATVEELAIRCQASERGMQRVLDALAAIGILDKASSSGSSAATYEVAAELRPYLLPGPQCVVDSIRHRAVLWRNWSKLTEVVRTGQPAVDPYENDERPDEDVRSFIGAMAVGARTHAPLAIAALDLAGVRTVLDIGGGPGVYAAEFCKASPEIRATILDFPRVCEIARENLAGTPYAERVGFVTGEARTVDHEAVMAASGGHGFDLVFSSSLIHSMDPQQVQTLLTRKVGWCAPGGRVVVKDFFMQENRIEPAGGAVFAINMLVNTPGGGTYTWTEGEEWLRGACESQGKTAAAIERIELEDGRSGMLCLRLAGAQ